MTDVTMSAGESLRLDVAVTNPDGSIRDITGATLDFVVYDSPLKYTLVLTGDAYVEDGESGTAVAQLDAADTELYGFGVFYYIVALNEPGGGYYYIQDGKLTVQASYDPS